MSKYTNKEGEVIKLLLDNSIKGSKRYETYSKKYEIFQTQKIKEKIENRKKKIDKICQNIQKNKEKN